jgi:DNA-3-methyladenine glycosylase
MYHEGGHIYMYLIYGIYWMLNFVTSTRNDPQAVLIRGVKGIDGPGKLTRELKLDKSYYGEDLVLSRRIWIEDAGLDVEILTSARIGIDYAGEYWSNIDWRYYSDF